MSDVDRARRFGGIARLYGDEALVRLSDAHAVVVGVGGVGSWVAEALARSGVGCLTLVDLDHVAESNLNRQIHALEDTLGMAKVDAMAERIAAINPDCQVHRVDDFVTPDNLSALLGHLPASTRGPCCVVDAIDQLRAKVALLAWCGSQGLATVTCGAAGGQSDPTRIRRADLSRTVQDPLLAKVRAQLRRDHGYPRDPKRKFGIAAVYSEEPLRYPEAACAPEPGAALACAGFGSSVCVTATFGLVAAGLALEQLIVPAAS